MQNDLRFVHWDGPARFANIPLRAAVGLARAGLNLMAQRPIIGSDFSDYDDRILLAELGYFSIDLPGKREQVEREALRVRYLEEAYDILHLDRKRVHAMIAAKMEVGKTDGIWARSTGQYTAACRAADDAILSQVPSIARSISEILTATPVQAGDET